MLHGELPSQRQAPSAWRHAARPTPMQRIGHLYGSRLDLRCDRCDACCVLRALQWRSPRSRSVARSTLSRALLLAPR
eukprot:2889297-Prymnesium_polylepis.1